MLTEASDVQPSNAQLPISVTPSGMVTDASDVQPLNAELPISVTLAGMLTEASDVQSRNAELPIFITPSGMAYSVAVLGFFASPSEQWTVAVSGSTPNALSMNHCACVPP